jgi:hypothetical protein
VVHGASGWRHLPAVPGTVDGPPRAGEGWTATFRWQETPIAFDAAELTFGDELYVQLPEPTARDGATGTLVLQVLRAAERGDATSAAASEQDESESDSLTDRVQQIRLETELLAAQEQVRELQTAAKHAAADVARVQADLDAERERHAGEAERFRDGLAQVRQLAEKTVADARHEAEARASELQEARAEIQHLRQRAVAVQELRDQLGEARADAQRTLDRLTQLADAVDDRDRA